MLQIFKNILMIGIGRSVHSEWSKCCHFSNEIENQKTIKSIQKKNYAKKMKTTTVATIMKQNKI